MPGRRACELAEKATDLADEVERLRNELEMANAAGCRLLLEVTTLRAMLEGVSN